MKFKINQPDNFKQSDNIVNPFQSNETNDTISEPPKKFTLNSQSKIQSNEELGRSGFSGYITVKSLYC
jgi:hypothetical protein